MNISESLPGHLLTRNDTKYLIVKAHDSTVVAAYRDKTGTLQKRADSARRSAAMHRRHRRGQRVRRRPRPARAAIHAGRLIDAGTASACRNRYWQDDVAELAGPVDAQQQLLVAARVVDRSSRPMLLTACRFTATMMSPGRKPALQRGAVGADVGDQHTGARRRIVFAAEVLQRNARQSHIDPLAGESARRLSAIRSKFTRFCLPSCNIVRFTLIADHQQRRLGVEVDHALDVAIVDPDEDVAGRDAGLRRRRCPCPPRRRRRPHRSSR